ncbi:MAG: transcriptional repressor [Bdellovibrionaceae bacterium]|nr:transcriptional repressor [Bdellovibrio sp.]
MKKHKDLVEFLKSRGLRMTPSKQHLIQFFLDNQNRHIPIKEIQDHLMSILPDVDRTTIYRNIEKFISLGLIQELDLPKKGKVYQFVFDKKVQHYYICKSCGKMNKGNEDLFKKIEKALKDIHDFSKANLSVLFYGFCSKCEGVFENEANL